MIPGLDESALKLWIETSLRDNTHILASGYQGKTLEYRDEHHHLVIKTPQAKGLVKNLHTAMLRHEYNVYQRLKGFSACPKCYGLVDDKYLVLEYIDAKPIREQKPESPEIFYKLLFDRINEMHRMQITHMDLKKKDNLLVGADQQPWLIDFGAAVIYKKGFHPLHHYWYNLAKQLDYNAWITHKYRDSEDDILPEDRKYYRRTLTERLAKRLRSFYRVLLRIIKVRP